MATWSSQKGRTFESEMLHAVTATKKKTFLRFLLRDRKKCTDKGNETACPFLSNNREYIRKSQNIFTEGSCE
jgi:hypothetical protein